MKIEWQIRPDLNMSYQGYARAKINGSDMDWGVLYDHEPDRIEIAKVEGQADRAFNRVLHPIWSPYEQ